MAIPTLAPNSTWFAPVNGTTRASITEINIVDSYTPTGNENDSWDASAAKDGGVMCYVNGTVLTMAGNGSGKIMANADSYKIFYNSKTDYFEALTAINGLDVLDTSNVTTLRIAFSRCISLRQLDLSSWNVANLENIAGMCQYCVSLEVVNLTGWGAAKLKETASAFGFYGDYGRSKLHTILGIENLDVSQAKNGNSMFQLCQSLVSLDLSKWDTKKFEDIGNMFYQCDNMTRLNLSGWDLSSIQNMNYVFGEMHNLKELTLGEKFRFVGYTELPTPDPAYIPNADGKWYRKSDGAAFTPEELAVAHTGTETYYAYPYVPLSGGAKYLINKIFSPVIAKALTDELFPLG